MDLIAFMPWSTGIAGRLGLSCSALDSRLDETTRHVHDSFQLFASLLKDVYLVQGHPIDAASGLSEEAAHQDRLYRNALIETDTLHFTDISEASSIFNRSTYRTY